MTEIRFYHLQKQNLDQALPLILTKAYQKKQPIIVRFSSAQEVERFNGHLWSFRPESFLPHGSEKDGNADKQPIWLTEKQDNPNEAKILILTQGVRDENIAGYDLCCEMLDGRSDEQVSAARKRWKQYKDEGHDITYWMQSETGGWEKKA